MNYILQWIFFKIVLPISMRGIRCTLDDGGSTALFGGSIRALPRKNKKYFNKGNFQHLINIFIFPTYVRQQPRLHPLRGVVVATDSEAHVARIAQD